MRWLHFSDLHISSKSGPQEEALVSLILFLKTVLQDNPGSIDAVFLVGDLAYSGRKEDFDKFEEIFLSQLRQLPELEGTKFYAVPGNHDVDCDAANPITWTGIRRRNQEVYFLENEAGRNARNPKTKVFQDYRTFVKRNGIFSPDPFEEVSALFKEAAFPFDVLATNTSFFSDKDEKSDDPITPSPISSMRDRLKGVNDGRPLIILGHHPISCFLADQQTPFETFVIDRKAVYLHGHLHKPRILPNADARYKQSDLVPHIWRHWEQRQKVLIETVLLFAISVTAFTSMDIVGIPILDVGMTQHDHNLPLP